MPRLRLRSPSSAVPSPSSEEAPGTLDLLDRVKAETLLTAYHLRWRDVALEVLAVDLEFVAPIVNPDTGKESRTYALGGKIGAIVRLPDGAVYVVEHRTTSQNIEEDAEYWRRLKLDAQVADYAVGARALGYDVVGCYYDVVAKPRLSPLAATPMEKRQYTKKDGRLYAGQRETDETLAEFGARLEANIAENAARYFGRAVVAREEREAALDAWNTAREIREADLALRHPRNPGACNTWGRLCEFFVVCTGEADMNDPARFGSVAVAACAEAALR